MTMFPDSAEQEQLVAAFAAAVGRMTVGFVKLTNVSGEEHGQPAGTGTLVSIGSVYGIITASHVLNELPDGGKVGLVRSWNESKPDRLLLIVENDWKLMIGSFPFGPLGPDIAFLRLTDGPLSSLKATNVFFNLAKREADFSILSKTYFDAIIGVIAENTRELPPSPPYEVVKGVGAMLGPGTIVKKYDANGFDLLDFDLSFGSEVKRPSSYGGMSGGGLWRMEIDHEKKKIRDQKLIGVAFYETESTEGRRLITAHGPNTIYRHVIERVRERWPA